MMIVDAFREPLPRTDLEILLAAFLCKDRTWVLAHPEYVLSPEEEKILSVWIERCKDGEPVAYITGKKEFYDREFVVTRDVLIPRQATEGLVDVVLQKGTGTFCPPGAPFQHTKRTCPLDTGIVAFISVWGNLDNVRTIVDIGTGSGCIAVTLACELPDVRVIATDISEAGLKIARKNAEHHHVAERITFLEGNLLEPVQDIQEPFLLVSNPPYIAEKGTGTFSVENVPVPLRFEPYQALFAGPDGMDVLRPLVSAARAHPFCRGCIVECQSHQASLLS